MLISRVVRLVQSESRKGPIDHDPELQRVDITEVKPGLPMRLNVQVVNADCTPVVGISPTDAPSGLLDWLRTRIRSAPARDKAGARAA